jgi:hypothetical protein
MAYSESIYELFDMYFVRAVQETGMKLDFDSMEAGFIGTMLKMMQEDLY